MFEKFRCLAGTSYKKKLWTKLQEEPSVCKILILELRVTGPQVTELATQLKSYKAILTKTFSYFILEAWPEYKTRGGSRILRRRGRQPMILSKLSKKLHEIEKILDRWRGGERRERPPLRPATENVDK